MLYGNIINLNENGQRIDAQGNQAPWRAGSQQPAFSFFVAAHGGVMKLGSETLKDGSKVPHVLCNDGTQIWGGKSVKEAADIARSKGEKFSLKATQVGEYIRGEYVANPETGVEEYRECLADDGKPIVAYTMFVPTVSEDDAITL